MVLENIRASKNQPPCFNKNETPKPATMSSNKEFEHLQEQIKELQLLVQKQNKVISKTGQQLIEFQVKSQKQAFHSLPDPLKKSHSALDPSEFASNEDLVQLVGELQLQLDTLEKRNILRIVNSAKTEDEDIIAPLTNQDGEEPSKETKFPTTLKNFKQLTDVDLYRLAKFYELVPAADSETEKLDDYLAGKIEDYNITEDVSEPAIKKEMEKNFTSSSDLDDLFNELARYLGLRVRKGDSAW